MTVLWLDDMRDPYKYFNKKSDSGAFVRNKGFYDDLFSKYDIDFIWVKNFEEFTDYILKNGIPEFVSFDHDLGKGLRKGLDCAQWLQEYCRKSGQPFPKYFVHSANPNGRREIEALLSAAINESKKRVITLNEDTLRNIVKKVVNEMYQQTVQSNIQIDYDVEDYKELCKSLYPLKSYIKEVKKLGGFSNKDDYKYFYDEIIDNFVSSNNLIDYLDTDSLRRDVLDTFEYDIYSDD